MKHTGKCKYLNKFATAVVLIGSTLGVSGCSTVTTGQTDHCIEQARNADVHGVYSADEQLNACLETNQLRRGKEKTIGEAFAGDVLISVIDIITD
ncbi:DNA ligase [Alteromonas sp. 07-89-2]|uniref:DNA ligase n=1 Tax=Alteromonas sp. 07-89-2 TaxID=2607609 RepID=UPI00148C0E78|nr:DNA ligase [Alteromonas sp. 07-89-2]NOH59283.1 DNA ligase [Alteromonas sp. 07-89-2]